MANIQGRCSVRFRTSTPTTSSCGPGKTQEQHPMEGGWKQYHISMVGYAVYVEFGTPPHIIRPKNGKALHWKSGGKNVFAKSVQHPGTRPQPFIRTTMRLDLPKIAMANARRHFGGQ